VRNPQEARPANPKTLLKVSGLTSHYGQVQALRGIDLEIKEGQLVALIGANGAGKTTLLRALSGVQPVSSGQALLFDQDMARLTSQDRVRQGICQVPEGRQVFGPMSVADNLLLGAYTRRDGAIASDMADMYAMFPVLEKKRGQPAGTLSGGQQQMLAIARALMGRPKLLLLDEPSMGLAPLLVQEIFNAVRKLRAEGKTILLVEQNARAALSLADYAYVMETGKTVLSGAGAELLDNEQVKRAYLGM
jgi:branched-chain amino acid transport system ATP-binding protein